MELYSDTIIDLEGNVVSGADILVLKENKTIADIYDTAGNPISSLKSGGRGEFAFKAENGKYYIQTSVNGNVLDLRGPVTLFDFNEISTGPPLVPTAFFDSVPSLLNGGSLNLQAQAFNNRLDLIDKQQAVSVFKFMTSEQINNCYLRIGTLDVSSAFQEAINHGSYVRIPPGVFSISQGLLQGSKQLFLEGSGESTVIKTSVSLFKFGDDNEKLYQLTISGMEIRSSAGYAIDLSYTYQSANQEHGLKINDVRFTGVSGIRLVRTAGVQIKHCQFDRLSGTAFYARLAVNVEIFGGEINGCSVPIAVDGDQNAATETAGISINGTRIIGNGAGYIKYCDQPSMCNVLYDYNSTLTLMGNIGGRFSGYFASANLNVIDYTAGVIGSEISARFAHYDSANGITLKLNGPVIVHGCHFQNAFKHIRLIGARAVINGCYFQQSIQGTRCIDADSGTSDVIVSNSQFEILGSGSEAFPVSVPNSWSFSGNRGTELDDVQTYTIVPGSLSAITSGFSKKRAPHSAICNTPGFYIAWATKDQFYVNTTSGSPLGNDQAVYVTFKY